MRLTEAELATMRAEHVITSTGIECNECLNGGFPCDAARLLAHFAPGPVPHLAGIDVGLLGPVTNEDLAR